MKKGADNSAPSVLFVCKLCQKFKHTVIMALYAFMAEIGIYDHLLFGGDLIIYRELC